MYQWRIKKINLEFNTEWIINGGSAKQKTNSFIIVKSKNLEGWGEISASTKEDDLKLINTHLNSINFQKVQTIDDIYKLNICPQVMAGLEMAWFHLQCKLQSKTIFEILKIKPNHQSKTSFSVPILTANQTLTYLNDYKIKRFPSCKIKIMGLNSLPSIKVLSDNFNGPIRIDANESFKSANEAIEFIKQTKSMNVQLLEQPLHRSNITEGIKLKANSSIPIIGDESLQNEDVTEKHVEQFHGLNIKLMKAGGYQQAINQLIQCKKLGLKTMVGCMVETSLNISAALNISADCDWLDLDGHLLLKNDPFSILTEENGLIIKN